MNPEYKSEQQDNYNPIKYTEMKRKDYDKPTMQVVELQQRGLLMTSGKVGSTNSINGWGDGGTDDEDIFM